MPIIEGYTPVFDIKTAQPPQINVAEIQSTGTVAPNAVTPLDSPQTRNRFIQEGINLRQRSLQNAQALNSPNIQPSAGKNKVTTLPQYRHRCTRL